jgi:hypothetical protein
MQDLNELLGIQGEQLTAAEANTASADAHVAAAAEELREVWATCFLRFDSFSVFRSFFFFFLNIFISTS